jgi:Uma2 family endonuclease
VREIVSPSNEATDRVLKMHYYADAKIPWYLLVEQDACTLSRYRIQGDAYREHAVAEFGQVLSLTEPIVAEIDTKALAVMR